MQQPGRRQSRGTNVRNKDARNPARAAVLGPGQGTTIRYPDGAVRRMLHFGKHRFFLFEHVEITSGPGKHAVAPSAGSSDPHIAVSPGGPTYHADTRSLSRLIVLGAPSPAVQSPWPCNPTPRRLSWLTLLYALRR